MPQMLSRLPPRVRDFIDLLGETYHEWRNDRVLRLGAGLAYYALFGIVPFLTILVAAAGLIFSNQDVQTFLKETLDGWVKGDVDALAAGLTEMIDGSLGGLGLIGAGTLLFAASVVFYALQDILNVIWHAPVRAGLENTLRRRVLAFGVVLLTAAVLIASFLVNAFIGLTQTVIPGDLAILDSLAPLITSASSWVLGICAIALLFRLLPYVEVPWRHAFIGGSAAALLAVTGSALFGIYFSTYGAASLSGVAGSIAVFLLWAYYQVQILLACAELTRVMGLRSQRDAG